jgi:hypothetical protein
MFVSTWKLRGCTECGGDLLREDDGYACLMCARFYEPLKPKTISRRRRRVISEPQAEQVA